MRTALNYYVEEHFNKSIPAKVGYFMDVRNTKKSREEYKYVVLQILTRDYGYDSSSGEGTNVEVVDESEPDILFDRGDEDEDEDEEGTGTILDSFLKRWKGIKGKKDFHLSKFLNSIIGPESRESKKYAPLYAMACDFLAIQSTSCESERAASLGKRILSGRETLGADNFRQEIIMKSWASTGIDLSEFAPPISALDGRAPAVKRKHFDTSDDDDEARKSKDNKKKKKRKEREESSSDGSDEEINDVESFGKRKKVHDVDITFNFSDDEF